MRPAAIEQVAKSYRAAAHPFDLLDMALGLLGVTSGQPAIIAGAVALYFARRSRAVAGALLRAMDAPPELAGHRYTAALLPGAARLLPAPADEPDEPALLDQAPADELQLLDQAPADQLRAALRALPARVGLADLTDRPAGTCAIPAGLASDGRGVWLDLASDTLHIGIYGQSGCGKDSLLRLWFVLLARRNAPAVVQFAFLDGKGDWLTASLASLAHMFVAPAGGYGAAGDAAIRVAVTRIDAEAQRRQSLITAAGCRTREEYISRTGAPMPLLVVVATDVMTSVAGEVESLLTNLVSKARSLGIRVIVSMQTPTGKDTKWRMNLSTVLAGSLQTGSQDEPALGIPAREQTYRPSRLPGPQERPGLFVIRRGGSLGLVQAPYLAESRFDDLAAQLPTRPQLAPPAPAAPPAPDLLAGLLAQLPTHPAPARVPRPAPPAKPEPPTPDADRLLAGLSGTGSQEPVPDPESAQNRPLQLPAPGTGSAGTADTGAVKPGTTVDDDQLIRVLVLRGVSGNKIVEIVGGNRAAVLDKVRQERQRLGM